MTTSININATYLKKMNIKIIFFIFLFNLLVNAPKPKFIILGFQKAGTTSFNNYFTQIGLKSAHYFANGEPVAYSIYKAKKENKPILHYLQSFDALTEINFDSPYGNTFSCYYPQIDDFEQIVKENPDAVFILNSRNITNQVQSMINFGTAFNYINYCKKKYLCKSFPLLNINDQKNVAVLLYNLISEHNAFLIDFFKNNPRYNFVDFSIELGNLTLLTPFLNLKPEYQNISFPHANENTKKMK